MNSNAGNTSLISIFNQAGALYKQADKSYTSAEANFKSANTFYSIKLPFAIPNVYYKVAIAAEVFALAEKRFKQAAALYTQAITKYNDFIQLHDKTQKPKLFAGPNLKTQFNKQKTAAAEAARLATILKKNIEICNKKATEASTFAKQTSELAKLKFNQISPYDTLDITPSIISDHVLQKLLDSLIAIKRNIFNPAKEIALALIKHINQIKQTKVNMNLYEQKAYYTFEKSTSVFEANEQFFNAYENNKIYDLIPDTNKNDYLYNLWRAILEIRLAYYSIPYAVVAVQEADQLEKNNQLQNAILRYNEAILIFNEIAIGFNQAAVNYGLIQKIHESTNIPAIELVKKTINAATAVAKAAHEAADAISEQAANLFDKISEADRSDIILINTRSSEQSGADGSDTMPAILKLKNSGYIEISGDPVSDNNQIHINYSNAGGSRKTRTRTLTRKHKNNNKHSHRKSHKQNKNKIGNRIRNNDRASKKRR